MTGRLLDELRRTLGDAAALALIEARGGTRLYVPEAAPGSKIAAAIGEDAARSLAGLWGRTYLTVPLAREWRAAHYAGAGASYAEIALKLGITESGVARLLQRGRRARAASKTADPRQTFLL